MNVYNSSRSLQNLKVSLEEAIFPEKLTIEKVIPVLKRDDKETVESYRPMFILPVISKVLERNMYNRLYESISFPKITFVFK